MLRYRAWLASSALAAALLISFGTAPARADQTAPELGHLFEELRTAKDPVMAGAMAALIWDKWSIAPTDTAALLFGRAEGLLAMDDLETARDVLDAAIDLAPTFAEAWNRRAEIHYRNDDLSRALADLRRTLELEPRHFGALETLGVIFLDLGEDAKALSAFEAALEINPHLEGVAERIRTLKIIVRGRRI